MASTQDKPSRKPTAKKTPAKPKAAATETAKPRASRRQAPTREAIAKRAYELSEAGGSDDVSHWLQAERELTGS